jgi:glycosyltransferase involved in cell wall biosynthesis
MALKRFAVLASHEPFQDPRIDWVARFAARQYLVEVQGIENPYRPASPTEEKNGYQICRHKRTYAGSASFIRGVLGCFAKSPMFWLLVLGVVFWTPIYLVYFLIRNLFYRNLRMLCKYVVPASLKNPLKKTESICFGWLQFFMMARQIWLIKYFLATSISLYRALRESPSRPDLVYCNDLDTLLAGVVWKSQYGAKLVYDAHEFWAHVDSESPWWEVAIYLRYERALLAHVDAAYTVNPLLAKVMEAELGHPFGSLPNCAPIESVSRLAAPSVHAAEMKALARGAVIFLYQGGFAPNRGIKELVHVWRCVNAARAVLFLRGPDNEHKTAYMNHARELGILDKSVFFLDPVTEDELIAAAEAADVGLIPYRAAIINHQFCCPNKLSQYMQAGLAILANNLDFVKSIVEKYECGLIYDINNESQFLATILRLADDREFRLACQLRARKMVALEYNWEEVSKPLFAMCAQLVELDEEPRTPLADYARVA